MKKQFLALIYIVLAVFAAQAQNPVNLIEPDSLKLPKDYNQFIPKDLSDIFDANVLLKNALNGFMRNHLSLHHYSEDPFFSFFPAHNSTEYLKNAYKNIAEVSVYKANYEKIKSYFLQNKDLQETIYNACLPLYQNAVRQMTMQETDLLFEDLNMALNYAKTFDAEKEQADEKRLGNKFIDKKKHLKAFIYRRIINNELSAAEAVAWLNRIIKDLSSALKKTKRKEDKYILGTPFFGTNYYRANSFGDDNFCIMEKKDSGYYFLLPEYSVFLRAQNYIEGLDLNCFSAVHPGGKKELLFFHQDTANIEVFQRIESSTILQSLQLLKSIIIARCDDFDYELFQYVPNGKGKRKLVKMSFAKKIKDARENEDLILLSFEDGTAELLYFVEGANGSILKREPIFAKVDGFTKARDANCAIINYKEKANELWQWTAAAMSKKIMKDTTDYRSIEKLNNFYLLSIPSSNGYSIEYKLMSKDAEFLLDTIFRRVSPIPRTSLFLLQKGSYYALFDSTMRALTAFEYSDIKPAPGTSMWLLQKGSYYALFDSTMQALTAFEYEYGLKKKYGSPYAGPFLVNNNVLLYKTTYRNDTLINVAATLFNRSGEIILFLKGGYVESLEPTKGANPKNYYAVCKNIEYYENKIVPIGKFALFDSEGNQLTDFLYNSIGPNFYDELGGYYFCLRDVLFLKLSTEGKELK